MNFSGGMHEKSCLEGHIKQKYPSGEGNFISTVLFSEHMFQKKNDLFVVELLGAEPMHLRRIAAATGIAPSTALRLLTKLQADGVVDRREEGRNAVYFLKSTPEATIHSLMAEHQKLLRLLEESELRRIYAEITRETDGELVILFGSHANGTANEGSDIDLYVETTDPKKERAIELISDRIHLTIGSLRKDSDFFKEIVKNHVILQNAERFFRLIA